MIRGTRQFWKELGEFKGQFSIDKEGRIRQASGYCPIESVASDDNAFRAARLMGLSENFVNAFVDAADNSYRSFSDQSRQNFNRLRGRILKTVGLSKCR